MQFIKKTEATDAYIDHSTQAELFVAIPEVLLQI